MKAWGKSPKLCYKHVSNMLNHISNVVKHANNMLKQVRNVKSC